MIDIENISRYYRGRFFALATQAEGTVLKVIEYNTGDYQSRPQPLAGPNDLFIMQPGEDVDDLYAQFTDCVTKIVQMIQSPSINDHLICMELCVRKKTNKQLKCCWRCL